MRTRKDFFLLYLKGVAMGAADAVPGVSGGTIAFISGIYEELVGAIRSFNTEALRRLIMRDFIGFWRHINGIFLTVLFTGIATSILVFSRVILYWLAEHPEMVWSFFFGLIVASAVVISRKIPRWNSIVIFWCMVGIGVGYFITIAVPAQTPDTLFFVFFSGMIAICAMILPGISGSFILVLLSKYEFVFTAIKDFRLTIMFVFGCGCAIGLLSFSHLLNWTLKRFHNPTIAALTGLMIGSLNKVWPWKQVVKSFTKPDGEVIPLVERNVLPETYRVVTGLEPYFFGALLLAVLGFCMVYFLEKLSGAEETREV